MTEPKVPSPLLRRVTDVGRALIVSHEEPDGDCIASSIALASALSRRGVETRQFNVGPFDRGEIVHYADRFEAEIPHTLRKPDGNTAVIVLDCSTEERVGRIGEQMVELPIYVIDHHASGGGFGDQRWVVPESPSTTYLVQLLIEAMGLAPTKSEAELLMYGFATDTGFFRHLLPHQGFAFHGLARLADYGVAPRAAHEWMYGGRTLASRRLIGTLLDRLQVYHDGRLLATWETIEDTETVGKVNRDSDAFYQLIFGIGDCEALIYLRQESPERCTGSLRSRDRVDVQSVAERFGGGGHRNAAGFLAEGTYDQILPRVVEAFDGAFANGATTTHAESR